MSSKTPNFNLHKIDLTDAPPDITVLNENWDTLDAKLKELSDDLVNQEGLTEHIENQINPHNVTAEQVGAIPIVDARGSSYDMDSIFKSGKHCTWYLTNSSTLGTPYAYGVIGSSEGLILSYASSSTYGSQWEFISGGLTRYRTMIDGVISEWTAPYLALSGGTLTGTATPSESKVRNISAGTTDLTTGSSALTTGAIYLVYE